MILLTAFKGETNSSKILLDRIVDSDICKLYLTNSFEVCNKEIIEAIDKTQPDYIFAFGQKPKSKKLYIETTAHRNETALKTCFDVEEMERTLKSADIPYCVSNNAGNYLCNHVYYSGLDYIKQHKHR